MVAVVPSHGNGSDGSRVMEPSLLRNVIRTVPSPSQEPHARRRNGPGRVGSTRNVSTASPPVIGPGGVSSTNWGLAMAGRWISSTSAKRSSVHASKAAWLVARNPP